MPLANRVRKPKQDPYDNVDPVLIAQRDDLVRRLIDGDTKIEAAIKAGKSRDIVEKWEEGWIRLLREYETVCDLIVGHHR